MTMTDEVFLAQFRGWIKELRNIGGRRPGTGACALASAMELWLWTIEHLVGAKDADGRVLYNSQRQGVTFSMADALCWLLASRFQIMDLLELEEKGPQNPILAESLPGFINFFSDMAHVQAARAAGESSRICTELVYGYNRHPSWEDVPTQSVFKGDDVTPEGTMAGFSDVLARLAMSLSVTDRTAKADPAFSFADLIHPASK
jgi:hypothetical protein